MGNLNPIGITDTNKQQIIKYGDACCENGEYKVCGDQEKRAIDFP